jgi:hypothetical protein
MVCPNCKSTDIVAIQGQNYCINCGQLVDAPSVKTVAVKPRPAGAAAVKLPAVTKRPPAPKVVARPKVDIKPTRPSAPGIINHSRKPVTTPPAKQQSKQFHDIRPPVKSAPLSQAPVTQPAKLSTPKAPIRQERKAQPQAIVPATQKPKPKLTSAWVAIKSALRRANFLAGALYALMIALVTLALFTLSQEAGFELKFARPAFELNDATMSILVALAAAAFAAYLFARLVRASAVYSVSKELDSRPVKQRLSRTAGLASLGGLITLDAITALGLIVIYLVYSSILALTSPASADPGIIELIIVVVTNAIALYLGLGLVAARTIGSLAIVLGGVSPLRALELGTRLYVRRFALIGSRFIILAVLGAGFVATLVVLHRLAESALYPLFGSIWHDRLVQAGVIGLAALTALLFGSGFWLSLYRRLIIERYPVKVLEYLSKRQAVPSLGSKVIGILAILLPIALLAAAWWLPDSMVELLRPIFD